MNEKVVLALVAAGVLLSGGFACLGSAAFLFAVSREKSAPAAGGQPGPAPTAKRAAGHFRGSVLGPDGGPIRAPGAVVTVSVAAVTGRGESVSFSPPVAADGTFDMKLIPGIYHAPYADMQLPVAGGKSYRIRLHPIPYDMKDTPSEQGLVRDFQWRLTGHIPGRDPDPSDHTRWYGGSVKMLFQTYREDTGKSVKQPPAGTKATFTLVPKGPLLDGSAAKTLTFERAYGWSGLDQGNLQDIPVADYTLTGFETLPDGTRRPLLIQKAYKEFVEAREISFAPDEHGGAWPPLVGFVPQE